MLSCFCLPVPLRRVRNDTYANDAYDDRRYCVGSNGAEGTSSVHRGVVKINDY